MVLIPYHTVIYQPTQGLPSFKSHAPLDKMPMAIENL